MSCFSTDGLPWRQEEEPVKDYGIGVEFDSDAYKKDLNEHLGKGAEVLLNHIPFGGGIMDRPEIKEACRDTLLELLQSYLPMLARLKAKEDADIAHLKALASGCGGMDFERDRAKRILREVYGEVHGVEV